MHCFKNVAIFGVGLIGGSIGMALRKRGLAKTVVGIGRRQVTLRSARRVGAVTNTTVEPAKGVAEAELVVVCTPVDQIADHVRLVAQHCPEGTLITDVGSTKQSIVEELDGKLPRGCRFLGSHPLGGREKAGPSYADAELFEGHVALITPTKNTRAEDFDLLEQFWSDLGSVVIQMSPEEHDRAVAITSHLPHVIATALASTVPEKYFRLVGAGLLDTTRIASGDPRVWKGVFMLNRANVLASLEQYAANLNSLVTAIHKGDPAELEQLITSAKKNRDALGN